MIMVDVYVPAYDKVYDMGVDEDMLISVVIDEMVNVITQKELSVLQGKHDEFILGSRQLEKIFSPERSLRDYKISNGASLVLV